MSLLNISVFFPPNSKRHLNHELSNDQIRVNSQQTENSVKLFESRRNIR